MSTNVRHKISLYAMSALYLLAGINHFINPTFYYALIPPYLPFPALLNLVSGAAEIVLAVLLLFSATRKLASFCIIALLIAFIPTHIFMIQKAGCMSASICVAEWVAWIRLFPFQFLLMYWAWTLRK